MSAAPRKWKESLLRMKATIEGLSVNWRMLAERLGEVDDRLRAVDQRLAASCYEEGERFASLEVSADIVAGAVLREGDE